jgi:hypothetical protein
MHREKFHAGARRWRRVALALGSLGLGALALAPAVSAAE